MARAERGVSRPNMVLPASAHAAFEKGCAYFDVASRRVPVRADWRADVAAMADAVDDQTVLVVASTPQYPQGVIDDVAGVAAIAAAHDINCHVDACMGGVILPYLDDVAPWNFDVDGVTSISVDLHKYGYTAKGAGVLVHRTKRLRSLPDLRHRQLARRPVRIVGHPRHEERRVDRRGVGRAAVPRRRRLPATGGRRPADVPAPGRGRRGRSRRCGCWPRRTPRWWPSPPTTPPPSPPGCASAAGSSTSRVRRRRCTAWSTRSTRRRSRRSSPTCASAPTATGPSGGPTAYATVD